MYQSIRFGFTKKKFIVVGAALLLLVVLLFSHNWAQDEQIVVSFDARLLRLRSLFLNTEKKAYTETQTHNRHQIRICVSIWIRFVVFFPSSTSSFSFSCVGRLRIRSITQCIDESNLFDI